MKGPEGLSSYFGKYLLEGCKKIWLTHQRLKSSFTNNFHNFFNFSIMLKIINILIIVK
jgi:hypothetical protein